MGKVYIVGIGPGSREYLLPLAEKTIRDADVLIGARRLLSMSGLHLGLSAFSVIFPPSPAKEKSKIKAGTKKKSFRGVKAGKKIMFFNGNYSKVLDYILRNKDKEKIVVLVSGDPGIFSFAQQITERLVPCEYEVIPGISSIQLAFARIGKSWQDAFIFSVHGRPKRGLAKAVLKHKKVFLFTDEKNNPANIASFLFRKGIRDREIFVFKNLSFPDEEIISTDIENLRKSEGKWGRLCVMIVDAQEEHYTV